MALLDLSNARGKTNSDWSVSPLRCQEAEELTKGAINWCLSSRTEVRGMARHCEPSDLRATEAAQPEVAADREQVAPGTAHQDARSEGITLPSPASEDTTFHAKSKSIHNNRLSPTSQKDFQTYKNWHLKTVFGRRSQARTSPDGQVDRPEPLFPPQEGTPF